jgi:glycosyltransferase involved in cell wall biosynthesis
VPVVAVIPAFQAAATLRDVVSRTRAAVPDARVVVVNDGSTDGSYAALADRVLIHEAQPAAPRCATALRKRSDLAHRSSSRWTLTGSIVPRRSRASSGLSRRGPPIWSWARATAMAPCLRRAA